MEGPRAWANERKPELKMLEFYDHLAAIFSTKQHV